MINLAGVLVVQGGQYVLQHRDNTPQISQPDTYSIWGGTMENNETPEEAAKRELLEETGVSITSKQLISLGDRDIVSTGPKTKGQPAHVWMFAVELDNIQSVECFEGQGIIRQSVGSANYEKMTSYTSKAIELYEAKAR